MTYPVTADDFGLHHTANQAIAELMTEGKLARVSILVNSPGTAEVFRYLKTHHPQIRIGLHLNLVEGHPVSDPQTIPSLVRRNGKFYPLLWLLLRLWLGQIDHQHIAIEGVAQLRELRKQGLVVDSINSHQNTHVFPPLQVMVYELARRHHIPHVRQESSVLRRLQRFPVKLMVYYLLQWWMQQRYHPYPVDASHRSFEEYIMHPGTRYD
jgi:chitin disaccharide deacetylase